MLYFKKNDPKIVVKWSWGSRGTAEFAVEMHGEYVVRGLGCQAPEKFESVYINNNSK